ncbi:MAG: DUF1302 family protein [Deltaproteobacteria bacterium]|nr:DUF1302 family protein [Deltaproteobacteria bacterium]
MDACFRRALVSILTALIGVGGLAESAPGRVFEVGPVDGVLDLTFAYGLSVRTQQRDFDFVGIANGGRVPSVNFDDGNLNYDQGVFANEFRFTGDLTLAWRNFGVFVRGFGFYDFESELSDRDRTELSRGARSRVGAGGELREYYLSANFTPGGMPIQFRAGKQTLNWGAGNFLRFGVDVVNPIDFVALTRPTATLRDLFTPQGMIWAASNVTELIAIEAFYQYDWEPVVDAPVGTFFSADDLIGAGVMNKYVTGAGDFSDLGTDLDDELGLAPGTLGFDANFMRVPSAGRDDPRDQGQYGFTVQMFLPMLNAASLRVHFINYHSRLPIISGIAADQDAIDAAVAIGDTNPSEDQKLLEFGRLSNETSFVAQYPEDIKMLGVSFDGALPYFGTLVDFEISHHFNWPVQIFSDRVIETALSPLRNALEGVPPGPVGADEVVSGIDETHKTQLAVGFAQAFGPRLWSAQSILAVNIGWVHFDGLSKGSLFDEDSWGYSIKGALSYDGVFGGANLEPFLAFTHDVSGITPGPAGAFLEERKSVAIGLTVNYTNSITADFIYVNFFDGKPLNAGVDRDFFSFSLRYYY